MHVDVVDPSAYTPPYDHGLCRALAEHGAHVQLHTSRFAHGPLAPPQLYRRREDFYRLAGRLRAPGARRLAKLCEHVPDMLRYRRAAADADVVHFQWLPVQQLDGPLLPPRAGADGAPRPLLLTAHDILPREPRLGQRRAQRRLYRRFDALVVHSEHGRRRLVEELGVPEDRVHVIAHGALAPWEGLPERPLPGELADATAEPVVLFFGLLRSYKGLDVLLEAWRGAGAGELWVVGAPRMDVAELRASAPPGVRWVPRFVEDGELHAVLRRASLVVLPYREIDHSGAAFTALGAGRPLLLSDAGGFPELARTGAARCVPAGDPDALREELRVLLGTPARLVEMSERAREAAAGPYSWGTIAASTIDLYARLRGDEPPLSPARTP